MTLGEPSHAAKTFWPFSIEIVFVYLEKIGLEKNIIESCIEGIGHSILKGGGRGMYWEQFFPHFITCETCDITLRD